MNLSRSCCEESGSTQSTFEIVVRMFFLLAFIIAAIVGGTALYKRYRTQKKKEKEMKHIRFVTFRGPTGECSRVQLNTKTRTFIIEGDSSDSDEPWVQYPNYKTDDKENDSEENSTEKEADCKKETPKDKKKPKNVTMNPVVNKIVYKEVIEDNKIQTQSSIEYQGLNDEGEQRLDRRRMMNRKMNMQKRMGLDKGKIEGRTTIIGYPIEKEGNTSDEISEILLVRKPLEEPAPQFRRKKRFSKNRWQCIDSPCTSTDCQSDMTNNGARFNPSFDEDVDKNEDNENEYFNNYLYPMYDGFRIACSKCTSKLPHTETIV